MWVGFHVSQEVKVPVFLQGASWGGGGGGYTGVFEFVSVNIHRWPHWGGWLHMCE